jgi:hypothetical protein
MSCKTHGVADEHERHDSTGEGSEVGEPGPGAAQDDEEFRLHSELGHEAKRVVAHPADETHRLAEELAEGEADTTPFIALTGLAIGLAVIVVIVLALVLVAIYLV